LFGKRLVYDIFDFYAEHLRRTPRWIKRVIRKVDFYAIRKADAVILVDDSRKAQLEGSRPRRLNMVYNTPEDQYESLRTKSGTRPPGLKLIYVGLLQVERGLLEMLEVLKNKPDWQLTLAGFGGDAEAILWEAKGLPNVSWHGRIPYQETLELTAASDVLIATYDPGIANHRYASPNKLFEAMMLAKPVIVARGTRMDEIIDTWECGLTVRYGDPRELEDRLNTLAEDPAYREALGRNGRRAYEEEYSWDTMRDRLLALYEDLRVR
jgi:glycosyltransferase involved in cell wall biosynthesis